MADKIKTSLEKCTALQIWTGLIFVICFIFFWVIRQSTHEWDDFSYLSDILNGRHINILLGRTGYAFLFGALWKLQLALGIPGLTLDVLIRNFNILFLALSYSLIFRILIYFKISIKTAVLTILLLIAELSFSVVSSRVTDSALMYFSVLASYYAFLIAHERKSLKLLFTSAGLFGYAFLVRESALFFFWFFGIAIAYFQSRDLRFQRKKYLESFLVFLFIAISGPLFLVFNYQDTFVRQFKLSLLNGSFTDSLNIVGRLLLLCQSQINLITVVPAILGFIIFLRKAERFWLISFLLICLAPVFITISVVNGDALIEPRLYLGLFLTLAFFQANAVVYLSNFFKGRIKYILQIVIAAILFGLSFERYWEQYQAEKKKAEQYNEYYSELKPFLVNEVVLILGSESAVVKYRAMSDGFNPVSISPGWSWPKGKLNQVIEDNLEVGRKVIYDPRSSAYRRVAREEDLKKMTERFQLQDIGSGFVGVRYK